jgi:hypothetical protein
MRGSRIAAFVVVAMLALASCGSRVAPLANGLSNGLGGGPNGGDGLGTGTLPAANPTAQTSLPGAPGTGGGAQPGAIGTTIPGLANCKATFSDPDHGVTPTLVKLGLIASITGPLPGQFNSEVEAVDAYVKMINGAGGVCGRKFQLIIRDDSGDGKTDLAAATKLAEEDHVFAFVGSASAPDDSGIAKISKKYKIPDIGFPLTWERADNKFTYGIPGIIRERMIGEGANGMPFLNKKYHVKQVALFWLREAEVSVIEAWGFEAAILHADPTIKICHEQPAGVLDTNYDNYVLAMKGDCQPQDGPVAVYSTMENNANIKLAIAMKGQDFEPAVFSPTFTSYLQSFIKEAQGATEGAYIAMPQIPFERLQQPASAWTPGTYELKRYMDTLSTYNPRHLEPGSFGAPGWGNAALFFQTAAACGDRLTRDCLYSKLDATPAFSVNGFLSPTVPSAHQIYSADLIVQVRNGKFVEIDEQNKSGPAGAPDFWDRSTLFDWQRFYCNNKPLWGRYAGGKTLVKC